METIGGAHEHIDDNDCFIADALAKEYGKNELPEEDEKFLQGIAFAIKHCVQCQARYNTFHGLHI